MKFRELEVGEFFLFGSRIHDSEIRKKVSRHTYVWVYPNGGVSRSWKARGESLVERINEGVVCHTVEVV